MVTCGLGLFAAISVSRSGARPEDRGRRHFGNIRQRASGRWQARYRHRGVWHSAPTTFDTAAKARNWLTKQDAAIQEDRWAPPGKGRAAVPTLRTYAAAWLADRNLEQTTRDHYAQILRDHVHPALGDVAVPRSLHRRPRLVCRHG
jgi:hypothetical protein